MLSNGAQQIICRSTLSMSREERMLWQESQSVKRTLPWDREKIDSRESVILDHPQHRLMLLANIADVPPP